ncbi:MAG: hypothetical protein HFI63_08580 [Lachnospiraceae bacterium]|nr:hypothetical protein [Lachnospiraceae bacterium]
MASILNIKPLLTIGENKVDAYEKVRGRKNCEKKLLKAMQERASHFKSQGYDIRIGIAGSFLDETDLSDWLARAKDAFPDDELLYDPLTCSITSHVVSYLPERSSSPSLCYLYKTVRCAD